MHSITLSDAAAANPFRRLADHGAQRTRRPGGGGRNRSQDETDSRFGFTLPQAWPYTAEDDRQAAAARYFRLVAGAGPALPRRRAADRENTAKSGENQQRTRRSAVCAVEF